MIEDTICNFLNLPGVIGLGLFQIQGQVETYLHFKQQLIGHEKQSLTGSITRIVEHLVKSPDLEFFEFPLWGYYAYVYKINKAVTLLVLTVQYLPAIKLLPAKQLQTALKKDINNTITTFQLLSKNNFNTSSPAITVRSKPNSQAVTVQNEDKFTIKDFLALFNKISKFSINYLGVKLTTNCWQSTCPNFEWLKSFKVNYSAEITFAGEGTECISNIQYYWLKEWTTAFIKQSSKIIKDFPVLLEVKCLTEREKRLLLLPINQEVKNYSFLPDGWGG